MFAYDSISVSSAWELTSVSMRYLQGDGVNTSLSRLMYCTHKLCSVVFGSSFALDSSLALKIRAQRQTHGWWYTLCPMACGGFFV